jgi:hypothetical protein
MTCELEYVELLAQATLVGWDVDTVHFYDIRLGERTDARSATLCFSARPPSGKYREFYVAFAPGDSLARATVNAVDQIQDRAVELTGGDLLPPCPGHGHPLVATVLGWVPKWVCMTEGAQRYARDILPGFDPAFTTPEEYLALR